MTSRTTHQIAVLAAIGAKDVSMDDLAKNLPISRKNISTAAARLIRRDCAERLEAGVYRLTQVGLDLLERGAPLRFYPKTRKAPAPRDSLQQRAWTAMRLTQRFGLAELLTLAVNERDKNPENTLHNFLRHLKIAGYIVELPKRLDGNATTSPGFKQWRLIRDTGPLSPRRIDKQKALLDANTQETFPCV